MSRAELREAGFGARSERFVDTSTGETLSRRQAQNVTLRGLGWTSRSEYERVMQDRRSKDVIQSVIRRARAGGAPVKLGPLIGPQTALAKDLRAAARGGWKRSQKGPWSRALIIAGMRAPDDRYRVGLSPMSPRHRRRKDPL